MNTIIYYFSGRGNSQKAAMDIAVKLKDARAVPFLHGLNGHYDQTSECIGFVFPVVDFGAPSHIPEFIGQIVQKSPLKYFFAVILNGGDPCGTMRQVEKAILRAGGTLSIGHLVDVRVLQGMVGSWETKLNEITTAVLNRDVFSIPQASFFDRVIRTELLNNKLTWFLNGLDKNFWVDDHCDGCGLCAELCPVENITILDGRPVWKHTCDQCYGCYAWCPKQAIHMGKRDNGRLRETNPEITLDDICIRKK